MMDDDYQFDQDPPRAKAKPQAHVMATTATRATVDPLVAHMDRQASLAAMRPRDVAASLKAVKDLILSMPELAKASFYVLKRTDKDDNEKIIRGPSIRLAELVLQNWQYVYIQTSATLPAPGDRYLTATANLIDMQNGTIISKQVMRRCTTRNGNQYGDDMMTMTANAAQSFALRNACTTLVPKMLLDVLVGDCIRYVESLEIQESQKVDPKTGKKGSMQDVLDRWVASIAKSSKNTLGEADVLKWLGITREEFAAEHAVQLKGAANRRDQESISWKQVFDMDEDLGKSNNSRADEMIDGGGK